MDLNPLKIILNCGKCGKNVVHGLHGNGMDDGKYMYEILQLVQTQKEWIQSQYLNGLAEQIC
jgi:hypothetical protein